MSESKRKILVVEDNADESQMLKMILELNGYQVALAANGREGLESVAADAPDLIVLDVMMPELDGFAMCARLRKQEQYRGIPVILLTAVGDHIRDTRYPLDGVLRAEADEYLPKPIKAETLLEKVTHLLAA
jgi:CheY-like chemotaxis protein